MFKTWWQQTTKCIFTDIKKKMISTLYIYLKKSFFTGFLYPKTGENVHFYFKQKILSSTSVVSYVAGDDDVDSE